jgi:hypothetical protein
MACRGRKLIRLKIRINNRIMGQINSVCFGREEMKFYVKG